MRAVRRWTAACLPALLLMACGAGVHPEIPRPCLDHVDPDVVRAVEEAVAAVRREPGSARAWGDLGDRYHVHDFLEEAAQAYARAAELDPEEPTWPYRMGWSLVNERPEEAAQALKRALVHLEQYAPAHEFYATVLMRLGHDQEAAECFARACQLDPASAPAETGLALLELKRGDLERARIHLEEAVRRDPRHTPAHVGLAQVYTALGLDDLALQHAERARKLPASPPREDRLGSPSPAPAGARARTQYALQLQRQGRTQEAIEQYRLALDSNPDHYAARLQLARLLLTLDRREEALELLREAERRSPTFFQVRQDLVALEQGRAEDE